MKRESLWKRGLLAVSLSAALGLSAGPALAAGALNADADEILRAMSRHLASLEAFSVSADISNQLRGSASIYFSLRPHPSAIARSAI
jgi:hypothetical protein